MKTKKVIYSGIIALAIGLTGCKKDDPTNVTTPIPPITYTNGVFVTNEGQFGSGTGTLSFYGRASGVVSNDIFQAKNGYTLGNVVQSMELFNGKGYIVVNNAGKVEVVDGTTLASNGVINGLNNPRYFIGINSTTGYISQWGTSGSGVIKVIDLNTKAITGSITTGNGPEAMVKTGNNVYVACSGGFSNDSVVSVIRTSTNSLATTINVGANPKYMKLDANGKLWVLCIGQYDATFTTLIKTGSLVRIDTTTNTVDFSLPFSSTSSQPTNLVENNTKTMLYYNYNGKTYSQSYTASILNTTATINRSFYGLGIDPTNDYFYGSDPLDYASNGRVIRYNSSGAVLDSFSAGVIPGNFCFK